MTKNMKRILTLALLIVSLSSFAQTSKKVEKKLKKISSIEQLDKLIKKYTDWQIDVVEINLNESKTDSRIKFLKEGETTTIKKNGEMFALKVLEVTSVKEFRVSHLYLNGKKLSLNEIDSLRTTVIKKYNDGVPFSKLSKKYASYEKPNDGDLGWFEEKMMVRDFEDAVKEHKKGDIFTVDIPSKDWYYVVLKTFDDRESRIIKMIRIRCSS